MHAQVILFTSLDTHMQKNTNLANLFAPWGTNIFKKCRAGKSIHCSYFALFWQHNMLDAGWLSCQSRQAQGCWSSTEQHFQCQWPATNSVGMISGQRRERTAPVSNSKPTDKISAQDFFIWVKFWIHKLRNMFWRLCCYWIIHQFLSHTDFLNASFYCGINTKQWKVD